MADSGAGKIVKSSRQRNVEMVQDRNRLIRMSSGTGSLDITSCKAIPSFAC